MWGSRPTPKKEGMFSAGQASLEQLEFVLHGRHLKSGSDNPTSVYCLMPRKLPASYLRKLNEEQKMAKLAADKKAERKERLQVPDSGRLKSYTMVCQACGTRAMFTVDDRGYATCTKCRAIASFRFGHLA